MPDRMSDFPAIDRSDPGYQRHCIMRPACDATVNILDIMAPEVGQDPVRGWNYAPRIFQGYVCPDHGALARQHIPEWVRVNGAVTGCQCACSRWMWLPGISKTLGDFQGRYVQHLISENSQDA